MNPVRATQVWTLVMLVGCIAAAIVARLAHSAWPGLRQTSFALFAGPGVALAFILLLLARKRLVARAKERVRGHLGPQGD
jgi:hypothetical protein